MRDRVLVADKEKLITTGIKNSLEQDGIDVDIASDGFEATDLAKDNEYSMILLDSALDSGEGFLVCRDIRSSSNAPIVMFAYDDEDISKVKGQEYGADDYIIKPFSILNVKTRIDNIMKKMAKMETSRNNKILTRGKIKVDFENGIVTVGDADVSLNSKEFGLLELLILNPGKVYSRDDLLSLIWGADYPGDVRTVDVHIRRLREKIEMDSNNHKYIHTKWGVGYYFKN